MDSLKDILQIGFAVIALLLVLAIPIWGLIRTVTIKKRLYVLKHGSEAARQRAATFLGEDETIEADEELTTALQREDSLRVRLAIINALIPISNVLLESAEEAKTRGGGGPTLTMGANPEYYLKALREYIVPALTEALHAPQREEQEAAAMALLWIGTRDALDALKSSPYSIQPPQVITTSPTDVQFSVYYPPRARVNVQHSIYLYAYERRKLLNAYKDVLESRDELSGLRPISKTAKQTIKLFSRALITVVPECDDIQFDPPSCTARWKAGWVRFAFSFVLQGSLANETLLVRFSIKVEEIEVAHVKCAIEVTDSSVIDISGHLVDTNPLAVAKFSSHSFIPYQNIFVSYSSDDKLVAEMYRHAQHAIGNDVFMDTYSIRAGENWQQALAKAIDTADVFQLFWSESSAKSTNVRDEWQYALKYKCPETRCKDFIRPVYWVKPIPAEPPNELKHLHFRYVPLKTRHSVP